MNNVFETDSSESFSGYGTPLSKEEINVIANTNNPQKKTPSSLALVELDEGDVSNTASIFSNQNVQDFAIGLYNQNKEGRFGAAALIGAALQSDVGKNIGTAFAQDILSEPQRVGQAMIQLGELAGDFKGKQPASVLKESFISRFGEGGQGVLRSVWGAEKDALLALAGSKDEDIPQTVITAGKSMIDKNQNQLKALGLIPRDDMQISSALGAGFASVARSFFLTLATRSPEVAGAYMFNRVNTDDYAELRKAGKTPEEASVYSGSDAVANALIESAGTSFLFKTLKGAPLMKKILLKTFGQGLEEGAQKASEETIMEQAGARQTSLWEKTQNVVFDFAIGMAVGAPISAIATKFEGRLEEAGATKSEAKSIVKQFAMNQPSITDAAVATVYKESAKMTSFAPEELNTQKAVAEVLSAKKVAEKAAESGEPISSPSDAAKVMAFKTKDYSIAKEFINLAKSNPTMEEVLAMSEKHGLSSFRLEPQNAEALADLAPEVIKGRLSKLSSDLEMVNSGIDKVLSSIVAREQSGKVTASLNTKLSKLLRARDNIESETRNLLKGRQKIVEQVTAPGSKKQVTVEAGKINSVYGTLIKEKTKAINEGFKKGKVLARQNIIVAQDFVSNLINNFDLSAESKGSFIPLIKKATLDNLPKVFDEVNRRINNTIEAEERRAAISEIDKLARKAKKSKSISIEYKSKIADLYRTVDTKKKTGTYMKSLEGTLDYLANNPEANLPKNVLSRIAGLASKSAGNMTIKELSDLYDAMLSLYKAGKLKLKLKESAKLTAVDKALSELEKTSVAFGPKEIGRPTPGTAISVAQTIKAAYDRSRVLANTLNLIKMPMDFLIDALDGVKSFTGANYKIFKKSVDKKYSEYLDYKDPKINRLSDLIKNNSITIEQLEKIGVYGVLKQRRGAEKLLHSGYTMEQIRDVALTDSEMEIYKAMSEEYASISSDLAKVMRDVYNKKFDVVKDYFPLITDYGLMQSKPVLDAISYYLVNKKTKDYFTKKRTGGEQAIKVNAWEVFSQYVTDASYLIKMSETIKFLEAVVSNPKYKSIVGVSGQEIMSDWVSLIARNGRQGPATSLADRGYRAIAQTLRRNTGLAVLGFKASTIAVQPLALINATPYIGTYVAKGVTNILTSSDWRKLAFEVMPEIRDRMGGDPSFEDFTPVNLESSKQNILKTAGAAYRKLQNLSLLPMRLLDAPAAASVAAGAYQKYMDENGLEIDFSKPANEEAIQYAQRMVRLSQSTGLAKDKPPIVVGTTGATIFQFQTFMLAQFAMIQQQMWNLGIKQGNPKVALAVFGAILTSMMAEVGVRHLLDQLIGSATGSPPEPLEDKLVEKITRQMTSTVPFASQIVNGFQYGSVPIPIASITQQIINESQYAKRSKAGSDAEARHRFNSIVLGAGLLAGVPGAVQAKQIVDKSAKKNKPKTTVSKTRKRRKKER